MSFFPPVCIRLGAVVVCFVGTVVYGLFCREQFARVGGAQKLSSKPHWQFNVVSCVFLFFLDLVFRLPALPMNKLIGVFVYVLLR